MDDIFIRIVCAVVFLFCAIWGGDKFMDFAIFYGNAVAVPPAFFRERIL